MGTVEAERGSVGAELLVQVAQEIRAVLRRTGLERTLAIGTIVLERFFGGSVSAWQERRNRKNNSVRRLAERPDCPLGRSALNRAVAISAVARSSPSILKLAQIEAGHIGAVLAVPAAEQEGWLQKANAARWSVRQLKDAIASHRRVSGMRRGRPPAPAFQRAMALMHVSLRQLENAASSLPEVEPESNAALQLRGLSERLSALNEKITDLRATVRPARRDSGVWPAIGREDPEEETFGKKVAS